MTGISQISRLVTAAAIVIAGGLALPSTARAEPPPKHVSGNTTIPVYSYAGAAREVVWVRSSVDSDGDGALDRIAVDIVRPVDPTQPDLKVPVIIEASPYYTCTNACGRGNELERKLYATTDPASPVSRMPLYYDNFFVPRGYAFLAVDLSGTGRSKGCADIGGPGEVLGAKAVVDWLNGKAKAFRADNTPVTAPWTNGKVGMIGKSWDGAIANAVAATGVPGLRTVVPISAVSSWYDWERLNAGLVAAVSSMDDLHLKVTGRPPAACAATRTTLQTAGAAVDHNAFWGQREPVAQAGNVQASVFAVHGMNDLNVKSSNFGRWWQQLAAHGVPRKVWLSQEGHVDPFDFRRAAWVQTLHRWFDQWLQDLDTGIMSEPMGSVERGADVWADSAVWPPTGTHNVVWSVRSGNGVTGELTTGAPQGGEAAVTDVAISEPNAAAAPEIGKAGRHVFLTAPLAADLHTAGAATVVLRIRSSVPSSALTVRLVDYGPRQRVNWELGSGITTLAPETCWGAQTPADDACYHETTKNVIATDTSVLSRAWLDTAHRKSLADPTPMPADTWETVVLRLHDTDQVIPAGHRLGLVVSLTDSTYTWKAATGGSVQIDLHRSLLRLPTAPA
ncbi:CocE/NonD family hydrolase [Dactylosporangium siamense]|nr:CocE/NonD family hydrolase [Dactylosporangium siamense]